MEKKSIFTQLTFNKLLAVSISNAVMLGIVAEVSYDNPPEENSTI